MASVAKTRSEMTEHEIRCLDFVIEQIRYSVSSENMIDEFGTKGIMKILDRKIYDHQILAANRLFWIQSEYNFWRRCARLLLLHDLGTGKTITALLMLAGIYVKCVNKNRFKALIVCPKAVLITWVRRYVF